MIQGDALTLLSALGAREGEPSLQKVLDFVGDHYEAEIYDESGIEEKYLVAVDRGVDFLLIDGVLNTIFIYAVDSADQRSYARWSELVEGIATSDTREDIVRVLGDPIAATGEYLRYGTSAGFLQFDLEEGRLKMLVLMAQVIGAGGGRSTRIPNLSRPRTLPCRERSRCSWGRSGERCSRPNISRSSAWPDRRTNPSMRSVGEFSGSTKFRHEPESPSSSGRTSLSAR
jgi:hypothetical protein